MYCSLLYVQYCIVMYTVQYSTAIPDHILPGTVFCFSRPSVGYQELYQYSTVQYSTVQYSTVQYSTVQYSTQYSTVQ